MSKIIPLTRGIEAIIDDEDYEYLNQWKWCAHKEGYAVRSASKQNGKREYIRMHRLIMNAKKGQIIDHINCNKVDNRKENLRFCTDMQNSQNQKKRKGLTSLYKGVDLFRGKYRAFIRVNKKQIYLGTFENEEAAAEAYNNAAINYHGEFARINKL